MVGSIEVDHQHRWVLDFRRMCTRLFPIAVIATACAFGSGCAKDHVEARDLLVDKDGQSHNDPTARSWRILYKTKSEQRQQRMVDDLVSIIESDRGYGRVVAARSLMWFLNDEDHFKFTTQRAVDAITAYAVRVARMDKFTNVRQVKEEDGWYNRPIDAAFEIAVDDVAVPVTDTEVGAMHGWKFGWRRALLDGRVVLEEARSFGMGHTVAFTGFQHLLADQDLAGPHEWYSEIQVIAPNGMSSVATGTWRFEVEMSENEGE